MPEPHTTQSQDSVFAFLANPDTHGGAEVTRIDTHGAAVFLAGDRVLKVKRAVKFPFLDYSTREKRKAACEAELRVNRPFAPQIYRRVLPITRDQSGGLAIGGDGEPVEWALEMWRFDETATLDHLAEAGKIDDSLAAIWREPSPPPIARRFRSKPIPGSMHWKAISARTNRPSANFPTCSQRTMPRN